MKLKTVSLTPLSIKPMDGENFRFLVGSRSSPGRKYLVDLEECVDSHGVANGRCDCKIFRCSYLPQLKRGAISCATLRCQHIKRARDYFCDMVLPKLAKALENK